MATLQEILERLSQNEAELAVAKSREQDAVRDEAALTEKMVETYGTADVGELEVMLAEKIETLAHLSDEAEELLKAIPEA